jgi:hypothetical protein
MHTIEISLKPNELSAAMADMRMWLDERRFEPSGFCCREDGASVSVRIDFKITAEAEAFADRFSGQLGRPPVPGSPRERVPNRQINQQPEGIVG